MSVAPIPASLQSDGTSRLLLGNVRSVALLPDARSTVFSEPLRPSVLSR
jgi:hypothetical protein